jgi:ribulose-phosphate 3-epimerase
MVGGLNRNVKLEASLACANFKNLEADFSQLEASGIDFLHMDLMDGRFVPNFALDFDTLRLAKETCSIPQGIHLMVEEPERYIERCVQSGASYVVIHYEATYHVQRVLQQIRDAGAKPGLALNPASPVSCLDYVLDDVDIVTVMTVNPGFAGQRLIPAMLRKIEDVRRLLASSGRKDIAIQVDGNVSFQNMPAMVAAGATMLVGGTSSIFHKGYSIAEAVNAVREIVKGDDVRK